MWKETIVDAEWKVYVVYVKIVIRSAWNIVACIWAATAC